ncbi:MAG: AraC family transcriptional regulator [Ardenticatenaceae bacterium]|nr:AraC family transcriptional regulator [Ardenticatenaceae bacterium]
MTYQQQKFEQLIQVVEQYTPHEGINRTAVTSLGTYKMSSELARSPEIETPAIVILLRGTKVCYVADEQYVYDGPKVLVGLYPVPVETEIVGATAANPFLAVGIEMDMGRLAELLLRIEHIEGSTPQPPSIDPSAKFSLALSDQLLDPFLRLFDVLKHPRDAAILSDAIIDEIYYRLLCGERGGELRILLQQKGKIKRISRAVEHIHTHLDQAVSVEELASVVHMSRTAFYTNFKEVMQLSPLQYAKSVKLLEAQRLIKSGKRVTETSYLVGYNNLAQFSREYKRQFGYAPSDTATAV